MHDAQCEAHYLSSTGRPPDCGCDARAAHPVITLPVNTEDAIDAQAPADLPADHDEPGAGERDLTQIVADRLTGNEWLPGAWVILNAIPNGAEIVLQVVTWESSVEPSARTEDRYVLQLVREDVATP